MHYIQRVFAGNKYSYVFLLALLLADRLLLLTQYNFNYVGNDDLIFWHGAKDYSQGIFHEPYFYGQNYNFMLESAFAAPLILMQVPYYYALPIVSSLLSFFPFILFSLVLYKRKYVSGAIVFLFIPLALPVEYGMTCSMTRGFISGLFFSGFLIYPVLEPERKRSWIIYALTLSLGYIFNPNSLVIAFPVGVYMLLKNYSRIGFYLISLAVMLPALAAEFFAKRFYELHPAYNTHPMWYFEFSFLKMISNFQSLDKFYTFFTPVFWLAGWLVLPLIIIAGIFLRKSDKQKAISLILGVGFVFATLGISKVNDSINDLLLSSSRMYLGIPLLTGLAFFWSRNLIRATDAKLIPGLVYTGIILFFIKASITNTVVKVHTYRTNYGCVAVKKVKELKCECEKLKQISAKYKPDIIAIVPNDTLNVAAMTFYDYGCQLVEKELPQTVMSVYEKRTWVFLSEIGNRRKNVLIFGTNITDSIAESLELKVVSKSPKMILFENNEERLDSLVNWLDRSSHKNFY